jgi:hypothetical protein
VHIPFDSSSQGRLDHARRRLLWKDLAPTQPRDNPQYAMYKDVLDAIARLVGEDAQ